MSYLSKIASRKLLAFILELILIIVGAVVILHLAFESGVHGQSSKWYSLILMLLYMGYAWLSLQIYKRM